MMAEIITPAFLSRAKADLLIKIFKLYTYMYGHPPARETRPMTPTQTFFVSLALLLLAVFVIANRRIEALRLKILLATPLLAASFYFLYVILAR